MNQNGCRIFVAHMAQSSHTSIERSDPEMAAMKIRAYEAIWTDAQEL